MINTRFIFVEGIMGSGKSTTAWYLTELLQQNAIPAKFLAEGPTIEQLEHPLRIATTLPHPNAVWLDISIEEYIALSLQKWRDFVYSAFQLATITVCDGLLFHGNMTDLLLMNASEELLSQYVSQIVECLRPLEPVLIYYYHADVAHAIRTICDTRGSAWEAYQINWKTFSPYGKEQGLQGFNGFVQLYQTYRALCDALFTELSLPKLAICNSDGNWSKYYQDILTFLQLPS